MTPSVTGTGPGTLPATTSTAPLSPVRGIRTIVHLPLRNAAELENLVAQQSQQGSPQYHAFLTPQQFAERYAPASSDLAAAASALKSLGFTTQVTTQSVVADADQSTVERAFKVDLRSVSSNGRTAVDNHGYTTSTAGYDQVIGVGTPYGNVFSADPFAGLAGDPQTTSNP